MKIIFLDFDGVVNTCNPEDYTNERFCGKTLRKFLPRTINELNEVTKETNAKYVISSTWRLIDGLEGLRDYCKNIMGLEGEIIDVTPNLSYSFTVRGNEIRQWISDNEDLLGCYSSDFKQYIIVDDDSDMLLWQADHFLNVDPFCGFNKNHTYRAIRMLNSFRNTKTFED